MPKEIRERLLSRASPYPSCSLESCDHAKEWEDARCPSCIEHPHNAVLLICVSYEKGCRSFMCDTSHRHSNCFDQFNKRDDDEQKKPDLVCPLCRQDVKGWMVVESARAFMNAKVRSCSSETCEFSGTYRELRKPAREAHPLVRPSQADPDRQRSWKMMQQQRDLGDLLSTMGDETSEDEIIYLVAHRFRPSLRALSSWSSTSGSSPQSRYTVIRQDARHINR